MIGLILALAILGALNLYIIPWREKRKKKKHQKWLESLSEEQRAEYNRKLHREIHEVVAKWHKRNMERIKAAQEEGKIIKI